MVAKSVARQWLALVWIVGSLILASVLFFQTMVSEIFAGQDVEIWDWLTRALIPNACLMLGVLGAEKLGKESASTFVSRTLVGLAIIISLAYLLALGVVMALIPLRFSLQPIEASSAPLKFFQALVGVVIGIFFAAKGEARDAA